MKTLDRYLINQFLSIFLVGLLLFVCLLELIDLFANLWKYLTYDASLLDIFRLSALYVPKCVSYALPVSLLFAVAYVLGSLHARNELTVFFSSGIPLYILVRSFLIIGILASFFSFWFEDAVVIDSFKRKNDLSRTLLNQSVNASGSDIVLKTDAGKIVFAVDFYNDVDKTLNGVSIITRNEAGAFLSLIQARKALWTGTSWRFENAVYYSWHEGAIRAGSLPPSLVFSENPDAFRRRTVEVETLHFREAKAFVQDLRDAGLPYAGALADYYKRFAFSVTPFIVVFLSITMGGRYRKNVLLMSLLASLLASVIFYVAQMLSMMVAKLGYIPPFAGAWLPSVLFLIIGVGLVGSART